MRFSGPDGIGLSTSGIPNFDIDGVQGDVLPGTNEFGDEWRDLRIFTKNACISTDAKITVLLAELDELPWDIVLFSEVRARDAAVVLEPGHKLYIYSQNNIHSGVGILVHERLAKMVRRIYRKR